MLSRPPHEVSSRFVFIRFIFFLDNSFDLHNRSSAFLMMRYGKGAGNTDKGNFFFFFFFLKPTSHTKTLFSTTTEQKEKKKERNRKYGHVIYTAFTHLSRP